MGRLASLINRAPDEAVNSRFDYTYDASGRRTSVTTLEGATLFGYDLLGQLTSVVLPSGRTIEYTYDAAGNRVRVVDDGITTSYAANNLNEYTSVGTATFTYDQNGNLETRTDAAGTTTYSYDALKQLVAVTGPGGSFSYEYDPFGNRVAETVNGVRREFLVSPTELGVVLGTYDDQGAPQASYAYGLGVVGQFDAANSYYFDFDALGSTIGLTDGFGGYVNQYSYLPFGETTIVAEAVANPFRYIGEWGVRDSGDGLLHMGVRAYDPTVGQFASDDPVSFAGQDTNLRRYVGNDPVQFIDPEGLTNQPPPVGWSAGISAEEYQKLHQKGVKCVEGADGVLRTEEVPWDDWINDLRSRRGDDALRNAPDYTKPKPKPPPEVIGDYEPTIQTKAPPQTSGSTLRNGLGKAARLLGRAAGAACAVGEGLQAYELSGAVWRTMVRDIEISNISLLIAAWDPNDIVGPAGPNDPLHFIKSDQAFPYTIRFENDPQLASAPAQEVFVTTQLDADLDWSTFELGDVGFGSAIIDVPAGLQSYHTRLNYQNQDGSRLLVDFSGSLDIATGVVEWTFRSIDPETGSLPNGVFDGFLPVNDASRRGEGFLYYLVRPRADLVSGDEISAQASIVFDINAAITTNVWLNTIDDAPPASSVSPLPAETLSETFTVFWSGQDNADGSTGAGIRTFDVFVSIDGGPFGLWLDDVTTTEAEYTGTFGRRYAFYSLATDLLGWEETEPPPAAGDAQTLLKAPAGTPPTVTNVQVHGRGWSTGFALGGWYSIPVGSGAQLQALPWTGIDQVRIRFSEPVTVAADDLTVLGVNVPTYSLVAGAFQYNAVTRSATWRLSSPVGADKILLLLHSSATDGVRDLGGLALDGE